MNFFSGGQLSYLLVFFSGLLSFVSLSMDSSSPLKKKRSIFHTVLLVLGTLFAMSLLLLAFTAIGNLFANRQSIFTRVVGIIIILLGLHQLGVVEYDSLQKDRRINLNTVDSQRNPAVTFAMGFTLIMGWTASIGPMLASVLLLAATAKTSLISVKLMLAYALAFTIPFSILGAMSDKQKQALSDKTNRMKHMGKVAGVILIIIGLMNFTGWMNHVSAYLNAAPDTSQKQEETAVTPAVDFTLMDQYGNEHTLSDYKGQVVFLNFWATWCPPCKKEMPDIEKLYHEYGQNEAEVVFLGIAAPRTDQNPNTREVNKEGVLAFLEENELTFPTLFDETGDIDGHYFVQALPTSFLVDREGHLVGYYPGLMTESIMRATIEDALQTTAIK